MSHNQKLQASIGASTGQEPGKTHNNNQRIQSAIADQAAKAAHQRRKEKPSKCPTVL